MVLGTELCLSSSGGGHNLCLTGTVDSSGRSLNRCGGRLYGVPVSEELPQSVATEVDSSMQFAGNLLASSSSSSSRT